MRGPRLEDRGQCSTPAQSASRRQGTRWQHSTQPTDTKGCTAPTPNQTSPPLCRTCSCTMCASCWKMPPSSTMVDSTCRGGRSGNNIRGAGATKQRDRQRRPNVPQACTRQSEQNTGIPCSAAQERTPPAQQPAELPPGARGPPTWCSASARLAMYWSWAGTMSACCCCPPPPSSGADSSLLPPCSPPRTAGASGLRALGGRKLAPAGCSSWWVGEGRHIMQTSQRCQPAAAHTLAAVAACLPQASSTSSALHQRRRAWLAEEWLPCRAALGRRAEHGLALLVGLQVVGARGQHVLELLGSGGGREGSVTL